MSNLLIFFTITLLVTISHASEFDFCVSNPKLPKGPEGYPCKDPANVTTDDFVFTGFRGNKKISNVYRYNVTLAFLNDFPGLNGQGISMARLDIGVGGVIPIHSHRTSELIVLIRGSIIAGFIDTNNNAYYKKLQVGDVMIFPQSMLHFQVNVGKKPAMAIVSLNAANPGIQFTSDSLFAGNLPANLAHKITLVSSKELMRMRKLLGGAA